MFGSAVTLTAHTVGCNVAYEQSLAWYMYSASCLPLKVSSIANHWEDHQCIVLSCSVQPPPLLRR
jgi:hypothetical protein